MCMKTNAERQAEFRARSVRLTGPEAMELLALIRDKGLHEFVRENEEFRSVYNKLLTHENRFLYINESSQGQGVV